MSTLHSSALTDGAIVTESTDRLTDALEAAARAFLERLDDSTPAEQPVPERDEPSPGQIYDPLVDAPPFPARPGGTLNERRMKDLAYLGAIGRINAEYKRGANTDEVAHFARVAGYAGGNSVTGWNSTAKSHRVIENVDGERILNATGHRYLHELARDLELTLAGDLTPLPTER